MWWFARQQNRGHNPFFNRSWKSDIETKRNQENKIPLLTRRVFVSSGTVFAFNIASVRILSASWEIATHSGCGFWVMNVINWSIVDIFFPCKERFVDQRALIALNFAY